MDHPPIILYTQTGCVESAQTRAWLQQRGLPFLERNVTDDAAAAQALAETGIFATPLVVVKTQKVLGFRPHAIEAALEASGIDP